MIYLILLINVLLLVSGQVLFKWGLEASPSGLSIRSISVTLLNPWILLGLVLYAVATLLWFYVLKRAPLSLAYPIQSLSYVLGLLVSRYVFHETIPWTRWVGVLVILFGVAIVAYQPRIDVG